MRILNIYIFIILFGLTLALPAQAVTIPKSIENLPVQYQGKTLPFSSFARELILGTTGKQSLRGETPTETVMRWLADPQAAYGEKLFKLNYEPLREELGMKKAPVEYSLNEILSMGRLMALAQESSRIKSQDGKTTLAQSGAEKILNKAGHLYSLVTNQVPSYMPDPNDPDGTWLSLLDSVDSNDKVAEGIKAGILSLTHSIHAGHTDQLNELTAELTTLIRTRWNPGEKRLKQYDAEIMYNRYKPIQFGRNLYLIAFVLMLFSLVGWTSRLVFISGWVISAGFAVHVVGMLIRTYVGGRAPWSNFYESLITLVGLMVLFGLTFSRGKMRGLVLGAVSFSGFAALMIADNAGLTPGIDTLVPALQSYWLTIHVVIIMAGYATAALAMVLGHVALGVEAFRPNDRALFIASTDAVYRAVQFAMLFIFVGTILGGVWAHEAWGRYWGWDPKETWALISWFAYVGVSHARFAGWLKPRGLALAAIGVFPIILMTYYGVNYLLSGLHSYAGGESASVPPMLIGFLIFEAIVVYAGIKGWHLKLMPPKAKAV